MAWSDLAVGAILAAATLSFVAALLLSLGRRLARHGEDASAHGR